MFCSPYILPLLLLLQISFFIFLQLFIHQLRSTSLMVSFLFLFSPSILPLLFIQLRSTKSCSHGSFSHSFFSLHSATATYSPAEKHQSCSWSTLMVSSPYILAILFIHQLLSHGFLSLQHAVYLLAEKHLLMAYSLMVFSPYILLILSIDWLRSTAHGFQPCILSALFIHLPCTQKMDGWMTCNFTSFFLTVFQSYKDNAQRIMKGCVQWNPVYDWEEFASNTGQLDQ